MDVIAGATVSILWPLEKNQEKHREAGPNVVLNQGQQLTLFRLSYFFKRLLVGFSYSPNISKWHKAISESVWAQINFIIILFYNI